MALVTLPLAGLACPQVRIAAPLLDHIVGGHSQLVSEEFLTKYASSTPGTESVVDLISSWCNTDPRFDVAWHTSFGDAHMALLSGEPFDAAVKLASVALRLTESIPTCDWSIFWDEPTTLTFANWLLPKATSMKVARAGTEVHVCTTLDGRSADLVFTEEDGERWLKADMVAPTAARGLPFKVTDANAVSQTVAARLLRADAYSFEANEICATNEWLDTARDAVNLIHAAAPAYLPWVTTVVRQVVPLQAQPGTYNSGGERYSPGVICVSNQCIKWALAEMLVHEATHQYMHIIMRLGALDDGSDTTLYFSPFRNKARPIFFIVAAYHAFANVLLFYRTAREAGFRPESSSDADPFANREQTLTEQLAIIEPTLVQCRSITDLGDTLWRPLRELVHA